MNEKFQNALKHKAQTTPPVWFMRQAGRYHQHYQNLRAQHSFMELCKNAELASEVALGPIQDFDFDVSIMFSDLLFPLEALGMGLEYTDKGPKLGWHLNTENYKKLKTASEAIDDLGFQKEVLQLTRQKLPKDKSLIGFVGGPWTLFVYACEGSHAGHLTYSKGHLDLFSGFCEVLVPLLEQNIQLQLEGGAEVVMIFDTAAGELAPDIYKQIIVPQLHRLMNRFPQQLGYYSKGTTESHVQAVQSNVWAGFGVDHRFDLSRVLSTSSSGFVQGNFDQTLLFQEPLQFKETIKKYFEKFEKLSPEERAGWVCGLGHGVLPKTPEENVRSFVKYVREVFK